MAYQLRELLLEDGSSPYANWFNDLPPEVAARIVTAMLRMQQGNLSNIEWFRGIGEYKIDTGPGWRIYLAKDGLQIIVLLGGGSKKRQQQDIDEALKLWEHYKRRKSSEHTGTRISKTKRKEGVIQ
ncbi:type II toxin-antitoxin system RelE/ParE family toxin [Ferrovum sp.]|uniref:type II toxin-antitoxin system RelE/ParE family toxin n=1 Tax=Ferrovum sp. TaxID=2609467 RepID=UPI002604EF1D|nr:type II toxin-antitoxin system RelE/ParE family toxin [Ferrovum sp.]